jgi:drug/metabolite transporter (DMT)-like permease
LSYRKYLVLIAITLFSAIGDTFLSRGMKEVGHVSIRDTFHLVLAVANPWVAIGIIFLVSLFACYASALSWADLTYVLPATSIGYVILAVIAKYGLHEQIGTARWIGIALISMGVGVVSGGPEVTRHRQHT